MTYKIKAWTRRQTFWLIAGLSGSLTLNACQKYSQSTETTSTKIISANSGSTLWIGYTPLYIALEKGFFQEARLNLNYWKTPANQPRGS